MRRISSSSAQATKATREHPQPDMVRANMWGWLWWGKCEMHSLNIQIQCLFTCCPIVATAVVVWWVKPLFRS